MNYPAATTYPRESPFEMMMEDHTLLNAIEERRLLSRAQAGDTDARDELILHNQRLVLKVALRYISLAGDQDLTDLVQWGNIGLMTAIKRFDLSTNHRFSTYAIWWIRSVIRRSALDFGRTIRSTSRDQEAYLRMSRTRSDLYQTLQREPTPAEVAETSGLTLNQVDGLKNQMDGPIKLDGIKTHVGGGYRTGFEDPGDWVEFIDLVPINSDDPVEEQAESNLRSQEVRSVLATLPDRLREVLERRYCCESPETLAEIGASWGLSRERVRQIEEVAIRELKEALILANVEH
jgi:RNA polymerase primary sigma factor